MDLIPVASQRYDIGKAVILGVSPPWDGSGDLFDSLVHYGTTEGEISIEANPEYSELTLPEVSGPAALKRFLSGERPTFSTGVFPDPDKLKLFSPTGAGSAGQQRRRRVREHTLWIVAEELFLKEDVNGNNQEVPITYDGTAFLKDGVALTAAEQQLVDMSMIIWRADFERVAPRYQHDEGGKSLKEITVTVQQDFTKPDGCQLYLMVSEAADYGIDFIGS